VWVDAVIGVSVTPSTVGIALVEGDSAADFDCGSLDAELFDVEDLDPDRAGAARDQIVATITRAEGVAIDNGRTLRSIGVTWSDGADVHAAELVADLHDAGFGNVVQVRFRQATDALARSIADVVGFDTTAVCVIEPEGALALTVDRDDGVVRTVRSRAIESVHGLTRWLRRALAASDRTTDALVVVGSAVDFEVDFDRLMPELQRALGIPVFTPADGDLALARGAALASARRGRFMFPDESTGTPRSRWTAGPLAPAAMLVVGVVTFVVSLSLAISQQITPRQETVPRQTQPVVNTSGTAAAVRQLPPSVPAAAPPVPPPHQAPVLDVAQAAPEPYAESPLAPGTEPPVPQALSPMTGATASPVVPPDTGAVLPPAEPQPFVIAPPPLTPEVAPQVESGVPPAPPAAPPAEAPLAEASLAEVSPPPDAPPPAPGPVAPPGP
jgi:hypothetical protein